MKKTLKLVPAIAMLLISAIMLSTATFAWFSMNNRVTVTGMTLKTKVSSNLLVSPDTTEANFITSLDQTRTALLEPTSTINGVNYYYTVNAKADGTKADGDWTLYNEDTSAAANNAGKDNYDNDFNAAYAIPTPSGTDYATAYGYVDYDFYLKATSTENSQKVAMTFCNLLYNHVSITDKAWRVAVLASGAQNTAAAAEADSVTLKTILAPNGAANHTSGEAVSAVDDTDTVLQPGTAATIGTLNAGDVKYFHVIVRVWLEGEDTTCTNSTYAALTNAYEFEVDFVLSSFDGIQEIKSVGGQATATNALLVATATLNTSETTGATYQWYLAAGTKIDGQTAATYEGTAGQEVYCVVSTTSGQAYQTNNVTLAAS